MQLKLWEMKNKGSYDLVDVRHCKPKSKIDPDTQPKCEVNLANKTSTQYLFDCCNLNHQKATIMFIIFWDFLMKKFPFHYMWNEVWLLIISWYIWVAKWLKT